MSYKKAPQVNPEGMTNSQLSRLHRVLDNLEETANMAIVYLEQSKGHGDEVTFLAELQEFLAAAKSDVVDALRERAPSDDWSGKQRLNAILAHEAWVGEFNMETVQQFNASPLAKEAFA